MASGCIAQSVVIDDGYIRERFPEYEHMTIFKQEYLDFFAEDPMRERSRTGYDVGVYVLEGDFDNDSRSEIAVAGLLDIEPKEGVYQCFIAVIEKETTSVEFFQKLVKPDGNERAIQNMVLFPGEDGGILIGFQYETDFTATISFDGDYSFTVDSP
ncbi:MAG: hypothetical protein MI717_08350 [Spirochaetales bacterium]|nr:hypothetical protein [Spirochaetales bacterium]